MQYSYNEGFKFEAKLAGSAGFNIEVDATNPSLSGSQSMSLLSAAYSFSTMSIGGGLMLGFKFGGMDATLSGSGSASGNINIKGIFIYPISHIYTLLIIIISTDQLVHRLVRISASCILRENSPSRIAPPPHTHRPRSLPITSTLPHSPSQQRSLAMRSCSSHTHHT